MIPGDISNPLFVRFYRRNRRSAVRELAVARHASARQARTMTTPRILVVMNRQVDAPHDTTVAIIEQALSRGLDRAHGPAAGCGVVCQERSCDRWSAE